jgi:hypothetical protein
MQKLLSSTSSSTLIKGPAGEIEILVTSPQKVTPSNQPYAIICHPHPLYGGSMTNKVVYILATTFNQLGIGAVRFNFRGVGQSTGQFDQGEGETEDLYAVAEWVTSQLKPTQLWLAGFSFGSYIALKGHKQLQASRLLLVAPPIERFNLANWQISNIPTLIIQGSKDDIVSPLAVSQWVAIQHHRPQLGWLEEADHFFHGHLHELRQTIIAAWGSKHD